MFPMISSRTYWADRAMQTFRYKLALLGILCASAASAQQGATVSVEYYQQRITEIDARAAALTWENAQLRKQIETLSKQLSDERAKADKSKTPDNNKKP